MRRTFGRERRQQEGASASRALSRRRERRTGIPIASHSCRFPESAANASEAQLSRLHDVKLPAPWCAPEELPPSPARSLEALASGGHHGAVTVLPSLLVPCCAHSGTTFLWRCMLYAFHPQRVCGSVSRSLHNPRYAHRVEEWSSGESACGNRRYLLPGLAGNIEGHWDYRKEWFFYGGGGPSWTKGWADYAGVELPLCYWEPEFQRELRTRPLDDTLLNSRRLCRGQVAPGAAGTSSGGSGGSGKDASSGMWKGRGQACTHRACTPLDLDKVRLSPAYAGEYNRTEKPRWQFQATKALPRVLPRVHSGAIVSDMTPNYLCSPKALRNLAGSLGAPAHFRMMLLVRPSIGMINASYKMFIQWCARCAHMRQASRYRTPRPMCALSVCHNVPPQPWCLCAGTGYARVTLRAT